MFSYSGFLILGTLLALLVANVAPHFYHDVAHPLHFWVNDIGMAFFFFIAAKEIREAMLPGGDLSSVKTAALPLMATAGGVIGPVVFFLAGAYLLDPSLYNGWAIPTATDIAFAYLLGRIIFGPKHPAVMFLLLLAVVDDGIGLAILAIFFPQGEFDVVTLCTLVGMGGLIGFGFNLLYKRTGHKLFNNFWLYLAVPGVMLWLGFYLGGLHPALALVPLAWLLPHAKQDEGILQELANHSHPDDALNKMEHFFKAPVEIMLGLFGFISAGIHLGAESFSVATVLVLGGLLLGKGLFIPLFTWVGLKMGLALPEGMNFKHVKVLGVVAAIGFTVAIFVSGVAFPPGHALDAAKMGALLSFVAFPAAILFARMLGIKPVTTANMVDEVHSGAHPAIGK